MRRHRRFRVILFGTLAAVTYFTRGHFLRAPSVHAQEADYAVAEACAGCHRNIWETYKRTGMARSFYRPSPMKAVEDYTRNNTFAPSNAAFGTVTGEFAWPRVIQFGLKILF